MGVNRPSHRSPANANLPVHDDGSEDEFEYEHGYYGRDENREDDDDDDDDESEEEEDEDEYRKRWGIPEAEKPQKEGEDLKSRNLVVCIDGTGNSFGRQTTNVLELYGNLIKNDKQLAFYRNGIGTYVDESHFSIYSLFLVLKSNFEMALAWNVDRTIKDAYRWLVQNYRKGDKIYLFGFSRGAYQVRVLSGMIGTVGLVNKDDESNIPMAYRLYVEQRAQPGGKKAAELKPSSSQHGILFLFIFACTLEALHLFLRRKLKGIWLWLVTCICMAAMLLLSLLVALLLEELRSHKELLSSKGSSKEPEVASLASEAEPDESEAEPDESEAEPEDTTDPQAEEVNETIQSQLNSFRKKLSRTDVKIQFLGCWDTVSSIGPPWASQPVLLEPLHHVETFRHALALDERRVAFRPKYIDEKERMLSREKPDDSKNNESGPKIKEVWFPGAHSDVGGTYSCAHWQDYCPTQQFGTPALDWMVQEAKRSGLLLEETDNFVTGRSRIRVSDSLTLGWRILEQLPWRKINNMTGEQKIRFKPHQGASRKIVPGQLLHRSVFMSKYRPIARPQKGLAMPLFWEQALRAAELNKPESNTGVKVEDYPDDAPSIGEPSGPQLTMYSEEPPSEVKLAETQPNTKRLEVEDNKGFYGWYCLHRPKTDAVKHTPSEVFDEEIVQLIGLIWIPALLQVVYTAYQYLYGEKRSASSEHIHDLLSLATLALLIRLTCKVFYLDGVISRYYDMAWIYGVNQRLLSIPVSFLPRAISVFVYVFRMSRKAFVRVSKGLKGLKD